MAKRFEASTVVNRPIEEVFDFLLDGENDKKFSSRVLEIDKKTDGPPGVGTVYASTVKDAGVKTEREFELSAVERPSEIRWRELSKAPVVVPNGGYDLEPAGEGTKLTLFNELVGRGIGVLIVGFAVRSARKSADGMVDQIKRVIEAS